MAVQNERRDWIIANWPHIVELEQVIQLITTQQPLAHWPAAQPDAVRDVLDQLRRLAPTLDTREERTLAELDRQETEHDPVLKLETRRDHLRELANRTTSPTEREAIRGELDGLGSELRQERRERTINETFSHYLPSPSDDARATRISTLAHDTLTTQPTWVIEYIRHLHDKHQLNSRDVAELATRITHAATHIDIHGHLPASWPEPSEIKVELDLPDLQVG
jgi:hypothetical protein